MSHLGQTLQKKRSHKLVFMVQTKGPVNTFTKCASGGLEIEGSTILQQLRVT